MCGITFISIIIFSLRDGDSRLSLMKALQLSLVGLIGLFPIIHNAIPLKLQVDFVTRWAVLGLNTFWSFVLTIFICSFLAAPLVCIVVFGLRLSDYAISGHFGYDVGNYGFIDAVKLKLGANPKSLKPK